MDIGQVTHLYRPSIGGIENYIHRLNRDTRSRGHTPHTYTTDMSLDGEAPVREEDVRYCSTTVAPMRNPLSLELHRELRRSDHDLYHLHSPWFLTSLEAAHALKDRPLVMTVHSAEIKSNSPLLRLVNAAYRPFARYVVNRVDHFFVQGETERRRLREGFDLDPDAVSVVPNGIRPEEYDVPESEVEAVAERYGFDPDRPTALFVSRLIPEKNPDVFVDAVNRLDGAVQGILIGGGDPAYVEELRSEAGPHVSFLSTLEFPELKAAYHAADLFVFLGTWEGLPTVILEAMNARLPVIATPVGAVPDAVDDPGNGALLDFPPTPDAVAAAVKRFAEDDALRSGVGERNRRKVRREYRWSDLSDSMIDKYEELAGRR